MVQTFRAVPETKKFEIEILDPEKDDGSTIKKIIVGYVRGPGCPVPVAIEIDRINAEYDREFPSPEQRNEMTSFEYFHAAKRADLISRRDFLAAVILGAHPDDDYINLLAADNAGGVEILTELGWYSAAVSEEEKEADEDKGEGKNGTGELKSQTPVPSTQESTS